MERELETMKTIMDQKDRDIENEGLHPLDPEGKAMTEHKRFTFDIVETPIDPLR